ncbi:MAG TPA: alpha-amylase/4-alpha-glucanotransferase domain-containing protein [Gemmatimonadaceae bacterium]|nr:alpha-amylase/4-alpha-glucanotransferase domain-containing protein [Gemmatimonadaceae bacterium]
MPKQPIRFVFGLHLHQPVGNFGHVFEDHVRDVYLPFLTHAKDSGLLPVAIHMSGPLLDWLERYDTRVLDLIGNLTSQGKIELLLAGYYEPVLAVIPRDDRLEQIAWMQHAIERRFGARATGLWLTERVWEPNLAADLVDAGVAFVIVDDRHFLVSGVGRERLHAPLWTESDGKRLALFAIDERLRYLIPFQPPRDTLAYLTSLRESGHQLAVLADDGEKFGGWPGTKDWVYDRGWLKEFTQTLLGAVERGEVMLSTFADALANVPSSGLAYLATASYREMEAWSLPSDSADQLADLEEQLGAEYLTRVGALIRGTHWRNFLVKYAEANRMHKKMLALSLLCRARGNPIEARRAIGRAQCNDAYWHGVFGGLYLPHLREAVWRELAHAERYLRAGEGASVEEIDLDVDGHTELWVHNESYSVTISPDRGAAIEEYTRFGDARNVVDTMTRRREPYHTVHAPSKPPAAVAHPERTDDNAPSIHEIAKSLHVSDAPPVDHDVRAMLQERVLPAEITQLEVERAVYRPIHSWTATAFHAKHIIDVGDAHVELEATDQGPMLTKRIHISSDGHMSIEFEWRGLDFDPGDWFSSELSFSQAPPIVSCDPTGTIWWYPIETIAKSERGLDRTKQGMTALVRWPVALGRGTLQIR